MDRHHGAGRRGDDARGDAAEEEPGHAGAAVGAEDDQIDVVESTELEKSIRSLRRFDGME